MAAKKTTAKKVETPKEEVKPVRIIARWNRRVGNSIVNESILLDKFPDGTLKTIQGDIYTPNGAESFEKV